MKKVLVWETLSLISGGQRMTLTVLDMLKDEYIFYCLIPNKGALSSELDARGISYTLMGDQTMPTGVKGKSVIFRYGWLSIKAVFKALKVIRHETPDIIYAPGPAALPWSAFCGSLTGKSVIWHLHHIFLDGTTKKLLNFCSAWKSVKKIISVSNVVSDQIVHVKTSEKKITIYNPVEFKKYANGEGAKIIEELSLTNRKNKIVIGHIALLQDSKRQDIVIKTIKELRQRGYDACALLVGRARKEDKNYVNYLKNLILDNKLSDYIYLLGQRNDVPNILKAIDVLMIPSSFEGFPLAGLEACAAGVPVVATDVGGCREFIEVSNNGLCFENGIAEKAADIICKIYNTDKYHGENGQKFALEKTLNKYEEKIKAIFREIAK